MIDNFMNVKEAALFIKRTERLVTHLCTKGDLVGARKEGLMWFIPKETLEIYILTHPTKTKKKNKGVVASEPQEIDAQVVTD